LKAFFHFPPYISKRHTKYVKQHLNTWIQLYDIYEIAPNEVDQKAGMTIEGTLSTKMIDDVVNCLFECESENIPQNRKDLLRPPMIDALQKLKARFDSCR
jgi:hypothetical protein